MSENKRSKSFFDFLLRPLIVLQFQISSEATGPIVTKFYVEPSEAEGTKFCSNGADHMTNMVVMSIDSNL